MKDERFVITCNFEYILVLHGQSQSEYNFHGTKQLSTYLDTNGKQLALLKFIAKRLAHKYRNVTMDDQTVK